MYKAANYFLSKILGSISALLCKGIIFIFTIKRLYIEKKEREREKEYYLKK